MNEQNNANTWVDPLDGQTGVGGATAKGNDPDDSTDCGPVAHGLPEKCRSQASRLEKGI